MAYSDQDYANARQWAVGRSGNELLGRATELGLSAADIGKVFGTDAATVQAQTGYGTDAGVRADASKYTFTGDQFQRAQEPLQNLGMSSPSMRDYQRSPYMDQMANSITQQSTRALQEGALPGIRSQSVASGGFGGSRQGIAEGLAIGRSQDALQGNLANLFNSDYQADRARALQQYGMDQNYNLGMGGLGLQQQGLNNQMTLGMAGLNNTRDIANMNNATTRYGVDANNGTQRYGIDQNYNLGLTNADNNRYSTDKSHEVGMANAAASQANASANSTLGQGRLAFDQQQYGGNMMLSLLDRQMAYNNAGIQAGGNIQNTPLNYWQQFSQGANSIGQGYGTSTQSGGGGNPMMGMLGGAQLGSQFGNMFNSSNSSNAGNNYAGSAGGLSGYSDFGRSSGGNGAWI